MCLAIPNEVVGKGDGATVTVRRGSRESTASLLATDEPVEVGDWVLVHSGLVLTRLTAQDVADYDRLLAAGGAS
jgi:hydrogenase assembly chaperone HypC/HupF